MAVLKCKMCGGDIVISENNSIAVCEYCGSRQTVPAIDNEKKLTLFQRANTLRISCEFDKAAGVYESIVAEFPDEAEAYWGLVLCKYGVEYVNDPVTKRRIPTVNRAQYTSVLNDNDYKSAVENADVNSKLCYEEEARAIDVIQKGILDISLKEKPFDVFICYKETDNAGRRTMDSVLATDLYNELTKEGFKVFFSRITLEDKIGIAYEPYIFAALNSAKVMVVIGTCAEHFNSVWVKNEWSRYLALINGGAKKVLVPAYKNMDPYDLPGEFAHLQAQDMSKLGFMQDLVRGIKKLCSDNSEVKKENAPQYTSGADALLRRAFIFLEDGDFVSANGYSEKVLDMNPECAEAYLVKLMINRKVSKKSLLASLTTPLENDPNYAKIMRYGTKEFVSEIRSYNTAIVNRLKSKDYQTERRRQAFELYIRRYPGAKDKPKLENLRLTISQRYDEYKKLKGGYSTIKAVMAISVIALSVAFIYTVTQSDAPDEGLLAGLIGGTIAAIGAFCLGMYSQSNRINKKKQQIEHLLQIESKLKHIPDFREEDYWEEIKKRQK